MKQEEICSLVYKYRNDALLAVLKEDYRFDGSLIVEATDEKELADKLAQVERYDYNPYRDKLGRFASKAGGGAVGGAVTGKKKAAPMKGAKGTRLTTLEKRAGLSGGTGDTPLGDADKNWTSVTNPSMKKGDLLTRHIGPDGKLKLAREVLHRRIVLDHFKGVQKADGQPTMTFLGGGSAAGKSTFTKNPKSNFPSKSQAVMVDPDGIKGMLPEYKSMVKRGNADAASFSHEESSALAKRVIATAQKNGYNVVLDGTGDNSVSSMTKKISQARAAGMKVEGAYCTCPTQVAVDRSMARAAKTGRKVPEDKIRTIHKNVSQILPEIADQFDSVKLYDTSTNNPVLVASGTRGNKLTVHDRKLYDDFIAKGNE